MNLKLYNISCFIILLMIFQNKNISIINYLLEIILIPNIKIMPFVVTANIYKSYINFFIWLESNTWDLYANSRLDNVDTGIVFSLLKGSVCTHLYLYLGKIVWIEVTYCILYKYIPQVKVIIALFNLNMNRKHFEIKVFKYCSF